MQFEGRDAAGKGGTMPKSRVGEVLKSVIRKNQIIPSIQTWYGLAPEKDSWRIVPIKIGKNSKMFKVGDFLFKEILKRAFIENPKQQTMRYVFLSQVKKQYPAIRMPIKPLDGSWFVTKNNRLYELYPYISGTRPYKRNSSDSISAARELGKLHTAFNALPASAKKLVSKNDIYKDTFKTFAYELSEYRKIIFKKRDRISLYLRDYIGVVEDSLAELKDLQRARSKLKKGFIHRDLHPENLLFNKKKGLPPFILDLDSVTWHEQILDVGFLIDRLCIDPRQPHRMPQKKQLTQAAGMLNAYSRNSTGLKPADIKQMIPILKEEYLKRTSSILRKHYFLKIPQDLNNLQRQSLLRVDGYLKIIN